MKIQRKNLPKSRVRLEITVPAETMTDFVAGAMKALAADLEIQGFRKGKAPAHLVRERLGDSRILSEALDRAVPALYHEAVTTEEIIPVDEPQIEVKKAGTDDELEFVAEVDVLPVIGLPHYEKLSVDAKKYQPEKVTDTQVTESLTNLQRRFAEPKTVDRAAKSGDWIEVSYTGSIGGVVQESLQSKHHPIVLGEGTFLPAFEEQLVGMKPNEAKKFTIQVTGSNNDEQSADFDVTLDKVAELELPALDDKLATQLGKKTFDELKQAVTDDLVMHAEAAAKAKLEQAVLDRLIDATQVELPESLIEREVQRRLDVLGEQLQMAGRTLESWLVTQKKDLETFRADIRPAAETAVKTSLTLRAVAEQEGHLKAGEPATEEGLKKTVEFLVKKLAQ